MLENPYIKLHKEIIMAGAILQVGSGQVHVVYGIAAFLKTATGYNKSRELLVRLFNRVKKEMESSRLFALSHNTNNYLNQLYPFYNS